jgi:DNA-binding beta-propeller fold protein YncE
VDSGVVRLAARFGAFGAIAADDDSGFVYVADADSNQILKYAPSRTGGERVALLATVGTGDYYVKQPHGLFWFADSLLVADTGNDAIKVISADTPFAGRGLVTGPTGDPLQLADPLDVWVDMAGFFYVADTGNSRVVKLTPQGKIKEVVTEFDREAARAPSALAATNEQVWVVDPERRRLTIYRINTGEELP